MAAAFPLRLRLRGAPLTTPHPSACSTSRLVVHASAALASAPRGGGRVGRRSVSAAAAAGDLSGSAPIASGAPAWDALGGVSVLAAGTGDAVPLTDLWDPTEGVAVVALLRHFGCFCCWELASVLKDSIVRFDSAGAKLIAIGVGTPDKARILADRLPFPVDSLYADPERKVPIPLPDLSELVECSVYCLPCTNSMENCSHYMLLMLMSLKAKIYSRLDYIKKATKNYTLEGTPTDLIGVLQQGGMFVFRGKELLYSWRDEGTGDHAPLDDVLSACRKTPVA
ncbi:hypothetical protein HU200_048149 [Digitaria exilis]|uniref:Uncharacterized protein n=1 Tax=Digitaria exilis TaxID=1010633 RepID=A0A835B141_9POAL|nr:hypothetical protein HU200_048149 [Digitaria exilis]